MGLGLGLRLGLGLAHLVHIGAVEVHLNVGHAPLTQADEVDRGCGRPTTPAPHAVLHAAWPRPCPRPRPRPRPWPRSRPRPGPCPGPRPRRRPRRRRAGLERPACRVGQPCGQGVELGGGAARAAEAAEGGARRSYLMPPLPFLSGFLLPRQVMKAERPHAVICVKSISLRSLVQSILLGRGAATSSTSGAGAASARGAAAGRSAGTAPASRGAFGTGWRLSCEYRNRKPSARAWAAWA